MGMFPDLVVTTLVLVVRLPWASVPCVVMVWSAKAFNKMLPHTPAAFFNETTAGGMPTT